MKKPNLLINIGLVFSLLFCLAFACNDGGEIGNTTNEKPIQNNGRDSDTDSVIKAQTGVGKPYGARDPYACSNTRQPTSGAISAAQATQYIICSEEKVSGGDLFLVENVRLSIGASVPDKANNYLGDEIDPNSPVYPIRASLEGYTCNKVSNITENEGENCSVYPRPSATGACAKTTFGDWRCRLKGSDYDVTKAKHKMPPPQ